MYHSISTTLLLLTIFLSIPITYISIEVVADSTYGIAINVASDGRTTLAIAFQCKPGMLGLDTSTLGFKSMLDFTLTYTKTERTYFTHIITPSVGIQVKEYGGIGSTLHIHYYKAAESYEVRARELAKEIEAKIPGVHIGEEKRVPISESTRILKASFNIDKLWNFVKNLIPKDLTIFIENKDADDIYAISIKIENTGSTEKPKFRSFIMIAIDLGYPFKYAKENIL